jgi:hypothetical protein
VAITAANKIAATGLSGTSFVTASLTPTNGRLYLATVFSYAAATPNIPTVTGGGGLTWVQVTTTISGGGLERVTLFRALKTTGLTSGTITASFGAQSQTSGAIIIDEVTTVNQTGTDGSVAVRQSNTAIGTGTTGTVTLPSAFNDATNNAVYATWRHLSAEVASPKAGWTELSDVGTVAGLETEYMVGQDLTATASWASNVAWEGIAVEIVRAPLTITGSATLAGTGSLSSYFATPGNIHIEAAFGYSPWATPAWTDISRYALAASWGYGRQNELNQMETGTASITLGGAKSEWEPNNPSSPFYPNVKLMLPVRAYIMSGASVYPLFYCFIVEKPRRLRVVDRWTEWELRLVDGMELLARAGLAGGVYGAELSSARMVNVLNNAGVPAAFREVGTGTITVSAVTFATDDQTKALTHALEVSDTEDGLFYWTPSGKFRFVSRSSLVTDAQWSLSAATFRDGPTSVAGEYPYADLVPVDDLQNVRNSWTGTRAGGTPQTADDTVSQANYGTRDQQVTSLATTDGAVLAQVLNKLGKFGLPMRRVDSIKIMPMVDSSDTGRIAAGLARVVGERVRVKETPPGSMFERSEEYAIQHVSGSLSAGPVVSAALEFQLWPASSLAGFFWKAGDSRLSLAGVSTRAAY